MLIDYKDKCLYNSTFGQGVANFGYATAMSFFVFILVAILAIINMKVGDTLSRKKKKPKMEFRYYSMIGRQKNVCPSGRKVDPVLWQKY